MAAPKPRPAALRVLNDRGPGMDRLKLLTPATRSSLVGYCQTWSKYVRAQAELDAYYAETGRMTIDAKQGTIPHPCVAMSRAEGVELRRWCTEFGFTPSAEGKLTVPEVDDDGDEFDPFS